MKPAAWILCLALGGAAFAQEAPPADSPGGKLHRVHALVDARVVTRPGVVLPRATVVIRDGIVEAVGAVSVPGDARVWDMRGRTIYPGLIEPYRLLDPSEDGVGAGARNPNPKVRAARDVSQEGGLSVEAREALRQAGFTAALCVPERGIFRGQSALVALDERGISERVIQARVAHHVAPAFGGWGDPVYPNSQMGAYALIRQTVFDARHHELAHGAYARAPLNQERPRVDVDLAALREVVDGKARVCFQAKSAQEALRLSALADELGLSGWLVLGKNDAFRWLDELQATGMPVVATLNYPPVPTWEGAEERVEISPRQLREWHLAPEDPSRLEQAGIRFAFSSAGLSSPGELRARVREAIERGLSPQAALAALTTAPAALLRAPQLGVITPGAIANLTVTNGDLFAEDSDVVEVWIDGQPHPTLPPPQRAQWLGSWELEVQIVGQAITWELTIKEDAGRLVAELTPWRAPGNEEEVDPQDVVRAYPRLSQTELRVTFPGRMVGGRMPAEFVLDYDGHLARGAFRAPDGLQGALEARKLAPRPEEGEEDVEEAPEVVVLARPSWPPLPEEAPDVVLVRGATLWTLGPKGTFVGDLLCNRGRIAAVGSQLAAPDGALVIDARGLHVTPGIVDAHSHSFLKSVNEGTHNCTAEVHMRDAIDAETPRIYQQLGGGVTTAHLLHGSANAIGGQSVVVRLRWGETPEGLIDGDANDTIKFALGENPKRSNWSDAPKRFPTTRMGVLESIRERFQAALDYTVEHTLWAQDPDPDKVPPRRDLQLEALGQVLRGERDVHCHSYRQDEILGLIRLAEEFGFTVGTFQHVLEGYKVADEIAAHGAHASTFSDWWAYKFEVYDAIAHNGALMWERGVLVSFNSDSSEMARRLNQEAAKAVRYGGVPPAEALKFVTLNPAIQLGLGDVAGSLEVDKRADFVVWSAPPLTVRARCLETWIGAQRYFQHERDAERHQALLAEREALLAAALRARALPGARTGGWTPTFAPPKKDDPHVHQGCCR